MSSKAYIVPEDNLTFMDQQKYRIGAMAAGIQRAYSLGLVSWNRQDMALPPDAQFPDSPDYNALFNYLAAGNWPRNLDVREFQPTLDAGAGAAADFWNTAALAAVGTEYSCIGAVAVAPAANRIKRVVAWYRVAVLTTPFPCNRLLFRRNTATGLLQAEFDLEQLSMELRPCGYLSEPVVWDNNVAYAINVMAMIATGVAAKVVLNGLVFEPAGTTNV